LIATGQDRPTHDGCNSTQDHCNGTAITLHLLPHWGLRLLALSLIAYSAFCFVADPRCRGKVEHRPGPTHEIGAVDQAAYKDAFLLEDA
jgi:hypothetical protein